MEESTLILTYAGMGLVVMMIGFIIFLQGAILEHPEQGQTLGKRVRLIGTGLFSIGVAYVVGCLFIASVPTYIGRIAVHREAARVIRRPLVGG